MSGLGSAAGREVVAYRDREVTRARRTRNLKGSAQVSARRMGWPCAREESSRTRCAASRCNRLARFFGHATPGSRRKRLFCMPEDHRRSPREAVQPKCESRSFKWRLAPLKPSSAHRVPPWAPAAERSTSPTRLALCRSGAQGFVRPIGPPRRDRPTQAARCRAGVVVQDAGPAFAHPATWRGP